MLQSEFNEMHFTLVHRHKVEGLVQRVERTGHHSHG